MNGEAYEAAADAMEAALKALEDDTDIECSEEYSLNVEEFIPYIRGVNVSNEYKQTLKDVGRGHLC